MKLLGILILMAGSLSYAGNGSGTLAAALEQMNQRGIINNGSIVSNPRTGEVKFGDIIYYQGENKTDVFVQYGKNQGNKWLIEGFKIDKQNPNLNYEIVDAIIKSKTNRDWTTIQINDFPTIK